MRRFRSDCLRAAANRLRDATNSVKANATAHVLSSKDCDGFIRLATTTLSEELNRLHFGLEERALFEAALARGDKDAATGLIAPAQERVRAEFAAKTGIDPRSIVPQSTVRSCERCSAGKKR